MTRLPLVDVTEAPTVEEVTILPTMSKTDYLLACLWPWEKKAPRDPGGEPARFGSACHEVWRRLTYDVKPNVAAIADAYNVDAEEVEHVVKTAWPTITKWCGGDNPWHEDFTKGTELTEYSLAYNMISGAARACESPDEATHVYPDRQPDELPGTGDRIFFTKKRDLVVLDYKTGFDVDQPAESGQLRSLMLALWRLAAGSGYPMFRGARRFIVGLVHAPRRSGGFPSIYADTLSFKDLERHEKALRYAWRRRGTSLSPGPLCQYCPYLTKCPTQSSMLVELKRGVNLTLTPERVGAIHLALAQYDSLAEKLKSQLRSFVAANGAVPRPDGKLLDLVEREYETLSKKSVTEALGEVAGARELERLRKRGCIPKTKRLELRAESEKMR